MEKLSKIYSKYFSLNYLGNNIENKLACIGITCYITNELRKKGKNISCYEVLLKVEKDSPEFYKNTFLKSLSVICEDFMYGCNEFPDFGIKPSEMPKQLKKILSNYSPF